MPVETHAHIRLPGFRDWRRVRRAYALLTQEDTAGAHALLADVCTRNEQQADLWLLRYAASQDVAHLRMAWKHRVSLGQLRQVIAPERDFGAFAPLYGDTLVWVDDEASLAVAIASLRAADGQHGQAWAALERLDERPARDLLLAALCTRMGDHTRACDLAEGLLDHEEYGPCARRLTALSALRDETPERALTVLAHRAHDAESLWALVLALDPAEPALAQHAARAAWDAYAMPQAADYLAEREDVTDEDTQARWDAEYAPIEP